MKSIYVIILSLVFTVEAFCQNSPEIDESHLELSKAMGIQKLIDDNLSQTEMSLKKTMRDVAADLKSKLPPLNQEEEAEFNDMLDHYVKTILDSIDSEKAAYIYTSKIAEEMSDEDMKFALEFYKSEEGQHLLEVVGEAAKILNEYFLKQMGDSTLIAKDELKNNINCFVKKLKNKK